MGLAGGLPRVVQGETFGEGTRPLIVTLEAALKEVGERMAAFMLPGFTSPGPMPPLGPVNGPAAGGCMRRLGYDVLVKGVQRVPHGTRGGAIVQRIISRRAPVWCVSLGMGRGVSRSPHQCFADSAR
jgi:hypothetical protein